MSRDLPPFLSIAVQRFTMPGYSPETRSIVVVRGETLRLDVAMTLSA